MILTHTQIEDIFWRVTMMVLELDPDSSDQSVIKKVRISWPLTDEGSSDWDRNDDTVFLRVAPANEMYGDLHDITHDYDSQTGALTEVVSYHKGYQVQWVCYGPGAQDIADCIRIGVLREPIRAILHKNGIAIIPNIQSPVHVPEQDEAGLWWNRCDVTARCYIYTSRKYTEGMIDTIPDIDLALRPDTDRFLRDGAGNVSTDGSGVVFEEHIEQEG